MTFKAFFYRAILSSVCIIIATVLFNICMNEYALFGNAGGKTINIWQNERTTKYLLSYNYIPSNFNGILFGPSVSDNLNTKLIKNYRIYNASLNGGNISEIKLIVENVIQRGQLKFMVVCLFPYLTKDHGRKTSYIDPQEYWGSLGSREMIRFYIKKYLIIHGILGGYYNDYGYYDFILEANKHKKPMQNKKVNGPQATKKNDQLIDHPQEEYIDEIAYCELDRVLRAARKRNIQIIAFYYPYYIEKFNEYRYMTYRKRIDSIFTRRDILYDMNTKEYDYFRKDNSNYFDKVHLSQRGADRLIKEINGILDKYLDVKSLKEVQYRYLKEHSGTITYIVR